MNIPIQTLNKTFNRIYLIGFLLLSIGIPPAFSSLTRSVFEVNKLLILRLVIIFIQCVDFKISFIKRQQRNDAKLTVVYNIWI